MHERHDSTAQRDRRVLEVWVQQRKTGKVRYYKLNAPPAEGSRLDGYFDRLGFKK